MQNLPRSGSAQLSAIVLITLLGGGIRSSPIAAQIPDSAKRVAVRDSARSEVHRRAHQVRWSEAAAGVGAVALLALLDEPAQRYTRKHRSNTLDDLSSTFRQGGEPVYYAGLSLGILAVGVIWGETDITRVGGRLTTSVAASAVAMQGMKMLIGRSRPNEGVGAFEFHPFTSLDDSTGLQARKAMPSGHATVAFALATSLADDIRSTPISILLYTVATGTAFSRVYDNRHWVSDAAMGALLGITTAKLVNGRWRIFNLKPPGFLVTPTGAPALSWTIPFSTSPGR